LSRSDKSTPSTPDPVRRRIPLSVFSLRPNTHTAHPTVEIQGAPRPQARTGLGRWAVAAFGIFAAGAAIFLWRAGAEGTADEARFTHIESTATGRAQTKVTDYGSALKWRNREVVVAIDDSIDELGTGAREAVQSAFGNWLETGAEFPRLRFESTRGKKPSERPDGVNTVMFAPIDLAGHKNDVAITLTFSDPKTGEIVEADIVINSHHPFAVLGAPHDSKPKADTQDDRSDDSDDDDRSGDTDSSGQRRAEGASARSCGPASTTGAECGKAYDLENAAVHEVGHFFGLGEDVEDTKTSMYQCISRCEVQKRTLEMGDREAAVGLYAGSATEAAAEANAGGCGGARVASTPVERGAVFPLAALAMAGLVARRRRR
jgi:hypothetical protein